jgi:hypothetical protein
MHTARREVKDAIRREGKVKLCWVPPRQISAMARERVMADATTAQGNRRGHADC